MKTNYIKSPHESDHWLTRAQQRRDFLRIAKIVVLVALAVIGYFIIVEALVGPQVMI